MTQTVSSAIRVLIPELTFPRNIRHLIHLKIKKESASSVSYRMVHIIDIIYITTRTSFTLSGIDLIQKGGSYALEGDVSDGSKARVYYPV